MVVNNFNLFRAAHAPAKTNSPLVVNAYAVLTFPITFQSFKPIRWWREQISQFRCIVQHLQFASRDHADIGESPDTFSVVKRLGITAFE